MKDKGLWTYRSPGIRDDLFVRGQVPMTKSEIRAVTISKLALDDGMTLIDIGAGTGSVSVEAALMGCQVTAIERNEEGVDLIRQNAVAFGDLPIDVILGKAPEDLPRDGLFDRAFIGGTGGGVKGIFDYLDHHLKVSGLVVANTITIENTGKILELLKTYGYIDIEVVQVNVSRSKSVGQVHMMMAENPITIIRGVKTETKEGN